MKCERFSVERINDTETIIFNTKYTYYDKQFAKVM